jgi:hydroxymethylbilane synthase
MRKLTYATRKSPLALAQCRAFVAALVRANDGLDTAELLVTTTGDRIQDRPLSEVGGKGLFVKEIEEALLDGRADLAVHSVKDVPARLPEGLVLACLPRRADPRDVLVAPRHGGLASLPPGARVGTSSLRRIMSLGRARPDLVFVPVRGNVDTRLRKVDAGEIDAIVLAGAGLARLGLEARVTEWLSPEVSLPAIGQGALGIEIRAADEAARAALAPLHDAETAVAVAAERGVMVALDGDCRTPIAAYGTRTADGEDLELRVMIADPDGSRVRQASRRTPWPAREEEARAFGLEVGAALR